MEQITLEIIGKHMKDKKMIGSNHQGFMKGKSCLTNLVAFCYEITGCWRAVVVAHLDLREVFSTVCHYILIEKLMKY